MFSYALVLHVETLEAFTAAQAVKYVPFFVSVPIKAVPTWSKGNNNHLFKSS